MASDLSVVNAARVSFARGKQELEPEDEGLIGFLLRNRHGTPVRAQRLPLSTCAARSSSCASGSGTAGRRSTSSACATRAPPTSSTCRPLEDVRRQVGKPGAYSFEPVEPALAEQARARRSRLTERGAAYADLQQPGRMPGVARELARAVLPVAAYTEFYWTVNARALMNFLSLPERRGSAARDPALRRDHRESCSRSEMPITHAAFVAAGRTRALVRQSALGGSGDDLAGTGRARLLARDLPTVRLFR
jgi:thymidylate synthase (FAD)